LLTNAKNGVIKMARSILPEGETDADRIADFVQGYTGMKKEQNRAAYEKAAAWIFASEVYRLARRATTGRSRGRR
jgi:hypothetical protein